MCCWCLACTGIYRSGNNLHKLLRAVEKVHLALHCDFHAPERQGIASAGPCTHAALLRQPAVCLNLHMTLWYAHALEKLLQLDQCCS